MHLFLYFSRNLICSVCLCGTERLEPILPISCLDFCRKLESFLAILQYVISKSICHQDFMMKNIYCDISRPRSSPHTQDDNGGKEETCVCRAEDNNNLFSPDYPQLNLTGLSSPELIDFCITLCVLV